MSDSSLNKGKDTRAPAPAEDTRGWVEVPWSVALRAGAMSAGTVVAWNVISPFVGFIPGAGVIMQFAGLTLPWLASGVGWYGASRELDVRAPLRAVLLAGLVHLLVDTCCILPLFLTPLLPLVWISRCGIEAAVNGAATTFFLRKFGRMKEAGDPDVSWDFWETPDAQEAAASRARAAEEAAKNPSTAGPLPGGGGALSQPPPQGARPPSPDGDEGTSVK